MKLITYIRIENVSGLNQKSQDLGGIGATKKINDTKFILKLKSTKDKADIQPIDIIYIEKNDDF